MQILMEEVCILRFYNTYYLCKNLIDIFSKTRVVTQETNKSYYINCWDEYVDALNAMKQIPMFEEAALKIYETIPVFVRRKERPLIDNVTKNTFVNLNNSLEAQMRTVIKLYESMELNNDKNGIDVKIPQCENLKEYTWYLKELDFVFTQCPYLLCDNEQIQFFNVDVGSNWLSFLIKVSGVSSAANTILNHLAIVMDKALVLKSHYNTLKQQEEMLRTSKTKNEIAEENLDTLKTLKAIYLQQATSALAEEISPLNDGEQQGKVEKSLEKLVELLDKGVEIYASIDTPKEVQVLFPTIGDNKKLSDSILKFIEDKNIDDSNKGEEE